MPDFFCAEIRHEGGRVLSGVAMTYGTPGRTYRGTERFEAGAFGQSVNGDLILNLYHDQDRPLARTNGGGLTIADTAESLSMRAELPNTRDADDALELVRSGVLRGLSVEFHPEQVRSEKGSRVISRARLVGIGLVARPAYDSTSVQARKKSGPATPRRVIF